MFKTTEISRQVTCKGRQERSPYRSIIKACQHQLTPNIADWRTKSKSNFNRHIFCEIFTHPAVNQKPKERNMVEMSRSIQLLMQNSGYGTVPLGEVTNYTQNKSTAT